MSTVADADPTGGCPPAVGDPCVVVDIVQGTTVVATDAISQQSLIAMQDRGPSDSYTVYDGDGKIITPRPDPDAATTVRALVQDALAKSGGSIGSVTFTDVRDDQGLRHELAQGELGAPPDTGFPDGLPPEVYPLAGTNLQYLRNARDSSDRNGAPGFSDGFFITTQANPALHITAHLSGHLLTPTIEATESPTGSGKFSFAIDDPQPGYTYAWDFGVSGTGDTSTSATPTYDYGSHPGSAYPVTLEVESDVDGSYGQASKLVTEGDLPTASSSNPGGPSGPSSGPTQPVHTLTPPSGPGGGESGPGHDGPSVTLPTGGTSSTGAATATATSDTGATSGAASPVGTLSTGPATQPAVPTVPLDTETPSSFLPPEDPVPDGAVVGVLLQAMAAPASTAPGGSTPDPQAHVADPNDPRPGINPYFWLVLSMIALLAVGAASEGRGFHAWVLRVRRSHRPWSRMGG